jgi:hypothetical protein
MIGAVDRIAVSEGVTADLYVLRFDQDGRLTSRRTAETFLETAATASDVFVFSHGWNNTYDLALQNYRRFIAGYGEQRRRLGLPLPPDYRPVLLGVVWPATSFVLPWESGPDIAGGPDPGQALVDEEMLTLVSGPLDREDRATLSELVDGRAALPRQDAETAAGLVLAALWPQDEADVALARPTAQDFLLSWQALDEATGGGVVLGGEDDVGSVGPGDEVDPDGPADLEPLAAGGFALDPRNLLRAATLWTMKSRAGKVGAHGVGPLLREVLGRGTPPRVHLVGHSFGGRVVLSAVAAGELPAPVHSMLLLQPAVNRWCFAADVPGTTGAGGYHAVPDRVVRPVLTTFSRRDLPLHDFFHLAVRGGSLGEPDIAGIGNTDLYGALGGYGPAGLGDLAVTVPALEPGSQPYDLTRGRVVAIDGGVVLGGRSAIGGHSDVLTPVTYWALHSLTAPEG